MPTDTELIGHATWSLAQQPIRAARALQRTVGVALKVREQNRQRPLTPPPAPFSAPATSMNGPLSADRSFAASSLSLADVKAVKNAFGCTVNDVVLAMCAGALRHYFDDMGEELDSSLVAMIPISVRTEDQKGTHGNQVSMMLASLETDRNDPTDRLRHIHDNMLVAKDQQNAIGADTLQQWAEFAAPAIFGRAARLYSNTRIADMHRPIFNVCISNVPGPPFPLYSAGAKLLANYPVGPIIDGTGLNMTVMSYMDQLDFGLLACPDVFDDVWASVGSANLNRRSWSHDSELTAAVLDDTRDTRDPVDPAGRGDGARVFARDLRLGLMREHLNRAPGDDADLLDPHDAVAAMEIAATALDRWHRGGRVGPRPPGQLRTHDPERMPRVTRLWATPLYRVIYDPDGRSLPDRWRRRW